MKLRTVFVGAAGATAMYFFDPDNGRRRRMRCRDRFDATTRRAPQGRSDTLSGEARTVPR